MGFDEQHRAECEAQYWLTQYRQLERLKGKRAAREWWVNTLDLLMRKRSKRAVEDLRRMINEQAKL